MIDKNVIRTFLATLIRKEMAIGDDDSLMVSKILDSLKTIELITFLETEFKVTFDGEDLSPENLDSINAIVTLLEQKQ
jgi:acyl carrier protein